VSGNLQTRALSVCVERLAGLGLNATQAADGRLTEQIDMVLRQSRSGLLATAAAA